MTSLNRFIEKELALRKKQYKENPTLIIENYFIEQQSIQTYNGRQLFEMLQNADDASETATKKKVLIKLTENQLIIANNGESFSADGFLSIIYSHISLKTKQQNKIGQKGLGFRSILSWADEVEIYSNGTKISFSESIAHEFLQELIQEEPVISDVIKKSSNVLYPIATLRVPKLMSVANKSVSDFDTIINLKLKPNILVDVQTQIHNVINKETLIFLNNIDEIVIDSPERKVLFTKRISGDSVTIDCHNYLTNTDETKTWHINKISGQHEYNNESEQGAKNYELAIAWNEELNDKENVLFSYFKTQVQFPFPALLHGTFELTPNRNHLDADTNGHNQFLIGKLADLLIETALKIAAVKSESNYLPLRLLNIDFEKVDTLLVSLNFKETLINKIKENKVFPTVNGNYISESQLPVFYDYPIADFLKGDDVSNLLLYSDDIEVVKFLKSFTLYYFKIGHYFKIASEQKNNLNNLTKLIFNGITYKKYEEVFSSEEFKLFDLPEFLIDNKGNHIKWTSKIFLQPQGVKEFNLPESFMLQFVEPELIKALLQEFDTKDIDILLAKLEPFQVKKYSFSEISETFIKHYNSKKGLTLNDIKELHKYLFQLFRIEVKKGKPEPLAEGVNTPVISKRNKRKASNEIYFGEHYGNKLAEQLYNFNKSKILAEKVTFGINDFDDKTVKEYFMWLGVAELPRYSQIKISGSKEDLYLQFVLKNFKYPLSKWNHSFESFSDVMKWLYWGASIYVGDFDEIDKILSHTKIEYIFEWINKDNRLRETLENDREILRESQITFVFRTTRYIDKKEMPSYTKWKISTSNFLPVLSDVSIASPEKCCLSKTITSDFSPFVEMPNISLSTISEKIQLSESVIENYLTLMGVHREISSFSTDVLYNMLFTLETSDSEGKVAKTIYREIISNYNQNKIDTSNDNYKKFIKDGKVLCEKGNFVGYFPISDAYYVETKILSKNILKRFPLICVDKKSGNEKVKKLLGVNPLDNISFRIIGEAKIHLLNNQFVNEIHRFKALIYALRLHKDTKHTIRSQIKRLRVHLTYDIKAEYLYKETAEKFEIELYDFIVTKNKSTFHIYVPESITNISELRQNYYFCNSISEIFTARINTEDYRDFIHHLYSIREFDREPELLNYLQQDTPEILHQSKRILEIIDDIRISFWNAFAIASGNKIKTEIRNEKELEVFLRKKLKLNSERISKVSSMETFNQLSEISNQEFIYYLFIDYKVDFVKFSRHFSGLDFTELFKNIFEDMKRAYYNDFTSHLCNNLNNESLKEKKGYFNRIDDYNNLTYSSEDGFLKDIEQYFKDKIQVNFSISVGNKKSDFAFNLMINNTLISLSKEGITIPAPLFENKSIQALMVFSEIEEIKKEIEKYNAFDSSKLPNQIKVRNKTIEYADYKSLAQQVLEGVDFSKFKFKISKTLSADDSINKPRVRKSSGKIRKVRFNAKNEEQVGFIAELLGYHKLCEKYEETNINWVSENGFRAYPDKFPTSEAGKGYDVEIYDESGKVRYIEIKGVEDIKDGIHMTNKEIKVALGFPDKYDLLVIENPLDSEPLFRYIRNPFKFRNDESLLSNKKLRVDFDNYLIKFQWDE